MYGGWPSFANNSGSLVHMYKHHGSSNTNQHSSSNSSTQVLRECYPANQHHRSSESCLPSSTGYYDPKEDGSGCTPTVGPPLLVPRRSHRPRGCRGGRKNRKNREAKTMVSTNRGTTFPRMCTPQKAVEGGVGGGGGDLSHYHHLNTTMKHDNGGNNNNSIDNAWAHRSPSILLPPSSTEKRQMLPPPLPPFVNGKDPFVAKEEEGISRFLKMLPSFDEPDQSFSSSSQDTLLDAHPTEEISSHLGDLFPWNLARSDQIHQQQQQQQSCPGGCSSLSSSSSTSSSTSSSQSIGGDRSDSMIIKAAAATVCSLFVTSPRSFLMGSVVQVQDGFPQSQFSLW